MKVCIMPLNHDSGARLFRGRNGYRLRFRLFPYEHGLAGLCTFPRDCHLFEIFGAMTIPQAKIKAVARASPRTIRENVWQVVLQLYPHRICELRGGASNIRA